MNPLVSILIPCYNYEKYVTDAIKSALGQTYKNIEVIVVNDGSTDNSLEVIRSFGDAIHCESIPNSGACAARNRALNISKGEYIQFLDADDVLSPDKISNHLPYLIEDKVDIVFGGAYFFGESEKLPDESNYPPLQGDPFIHLLNWPLGTAYPLHKRKWLERVGGFNEKLARAQEYDLHIRLTAKGARVIILNDKLLGVRMHDQPRITSKKYPQDNVLKLILNIASEMETEDLMTKERRIALSQKICRHSSYSFRNGDRKLAKKGFSCAKALSGYYYYPERLWVKIIAVIVGPYGAECFLDYLRVLFRKK